MKARDVLTDCALKEHNLAVHPVAGLESYVSLTNQWQPAILHRAVNPAFDSTHSALVLLAGTLPRTSAANTMILQGSQ